MPDARSTKHATCEEALEPRAPEELWHVYYGVGPTCELEAYCGHTWDHDESPYGINDLQAWVSAHNPLTDEWCEVCTSDPEVQMALLVAVGI